MKAIRVHEFGEPEVMRLEEIPESSPSAGQITVKVAAAGVNPVDTYIRSGKYAAGPDLPFTPGFDGAGIAEAVGAGVKNIKEGDRVYIAGSVSGTYAEKALCSESQVFPLPEHLSFSMGAAIGIPYTTAYRALFDRAQAHHGESVLIHGASGGVGIAAVQMAHAAGLMVIGTGGSERGRQLILQQGAQHALDHISPDHMDQVFRITEGRGVDIVLEMLANVNLGRDLSVLAFSGRVVVIGSRGTVEIDPRDIMRRNAEVLGMVILNTPAKELSAIHAALRNWFSDHTLCPVIRQELPLHDASQAHHAVIESEAYGKIVLIP